jgi:hypothetical protein
MSFIQNLFTSRDNNANAVTYVGQQDRLWWNPDSNSFYYSDGNTAGGIPVNLATGANITANTITVNTITSTGGNVAVTGNLVISGNISPAAAGKIGGIQPGPGVVIGNTGILTIDSANLPVSFGNFFANNNILSIVNTDEDMILVTQGNAEIQLVGNVGFYKANGLPPDPGNLFFFARDDGQLRIFVPVEDPLEGGVEIIGSATGNYITPGQTGTMLQLTGNPGVPCRFYMDGNDDYASIIGRRFNGNVAVPTQVLAGEDVLRINATAATNVGMANVAIAQIQFRALENQTATAQGSTMNFIVTPVGQPTANRVEVANITVANGVSATKFTSAGNIVAGNLLTGGLITATGNITGGNILSTGKITSNSATAGIGYQTGAGGTVTQLVSKSTAVTLNTITGEITSNAASLSGATTVTFTLNNSAIANTDVMIINQISATNLGDYLFLPVCNTGAANITILNRSNSPHADAIVMRFAVIKGAVN